MGMTESTATSARATSAIPSLGTTIRTDSGIAGVVSATFADSAWARKFLECPRCDRTTWNVNTDEADLSLDGGPQCLVVDALGGWRMVDAGLIVEVKAR